MLQFEVPAVFYADDNTPNGTFVAQVKACDPDGPGYNEMFYEQYTVPNNSAHICKIFTKDLQDCINTFFQYSIWFSSIMFVIFIPKKFFNIFSVMNFFFQLLDFKITIVLVTGKHCLCY